MVRINNSGVAFLTVLILVLVLTILANVLLVLISNQTHLIESNIKRTKAIYATEAAMVERVEKLRKGVAPPSSTLVAGINVTMTQASGSGIANTDTMEFSQDYSSN